MNKEIKKSILILMTGTSMAQVITLLGTPIITHYYSKSDVGIFFFILSITTLSRAVISLRLETAVVLPKEDEDGAHLLLLAFFFNTIFNFILWILLYFLHPYIDTLLKDKALDNLWIFIPFITWLFTNFEILSYWHNRKKKYLYISIGRIIKSVASMSVFIGFIFFIPNIYGLLIGVLIGHTLSFSTSFYLGFQSLMKEISNYSTKRMIILFKKYRSIPIYNTFLAFLNNISSHMPIFFLTFAFTKEATADYGMALRLILLPMWMIANATGQVFFKEVSEKINNNSLITPFIKKGYKKLILVAIIGFGALYILTYLIPILLGENYYNTGMISRILMPWLFISFINNPISWIVLSLNEQKRQTTLEILLVLARILAFYICYLYLLNLEITLAVYSLLGLIYGLTLTSFLFRIAKKYDKKNQYNH